MLEIIEDWIFGRLHAEANNTLLSGTERLSTEELLTELKNLIIDTDFFGKCTRERAKSWF